MAAVSLQGRADGRTVLWCAAGSLKGTDPGFLCAPLTQIAEESAVPRANGGESGSPGGVRLGGRGRPGCWNVLCINFSPLRLQVVHFAW